MLNNFGPCCPGFTLLSEQDGQSLHTTPGDAGGATSWGITQAEYSSYLGRPASMDDMAALTATSVLPIYQKRYWGTIEGDLLPCGFDLMVFDHGVTAGWFDSAKVFQTVLRVVVDGWIGSKTIAAAVSLDRSVVSAATLIGKLAYAQELDYRDDAGFPQFGNGWLARLDRRVTAAQGMLFNHPPPATS